MNEAFEVNAFCFRLTIERFLEDGVGPEDVRCEKSGERRLVALGSTSPKWSRRSARTTDDRVAYVARRPQHMW